VTTREFNVGRKIILEGMFGSVEAGRGDGTG